MAKLIRECTGNKYIEDSKEWQVGDRFKLTVYLGDENYSFFVDDRIQHNNPLKLVPQIIKDLNLISDLNIELLPSIDTCGMKVSRKKHEKFFRLLEEYLLVIEKNSNRSLDEMK